MKNGPVEQMSLSGVPREFSFVVNLKWRGISPPVNQALGLTGGNKEICRKYPLNTRPFISSTERNNDRSGHVDFKINRTPVLVN
jgi:hypothetical protein